MIDDTLYDSAYDDDDRSYNASVDNCGGSIADYSLEDWPYVLGSPYPEDEPYELSDPKHPDFHDTYSEISDNYDPF